MKKIQLLLLSLLLVLPMNGYAQQALYGDVNGDNEVNIADVNAVVGIILDGNGFTAAADVNGDGEINIADIYAVINIILTGQTIVEDQDWVDLGLPSGTIWATRNVGASSPEDYGDYFAWGETEPKDYYDWSTYKWCNGSYYTLTKYCTSSGKGYNGFVDNKTELDPSDDAACAHYPGGRMPSLKQIIELRDKCTYQWTQRNGVNGGLVTGPNGNTMFLPAAGFRWDGSLSSAASMGCYWSRTLTSHLPDYAYGHAFGSNYWGDWFNYYRRNDGRSVRAVRVSQN